MFEAGNTLRMLDMLIFNNAIVAPYGKVRICTLQCMKFESHMIRVMLLLIPVIMLESTMSVKNHYTRSFVDNYEIVCGERQHEWMINFCSGGTSSDFCRWRCTLVRGQAVTIVFAPFLSS